MYQILRYIIQNLVKAQHKIIELAWKVTKEENQTLQEIKVKSGFNQISISQLAILKPKNITPNTLKPA